MNDTINEKELAIVKQQTTKAHRAAADLVIGSDSDMVMAADMLGKIKRVQKLIKQRKEAITKPINEALRNVRALFSPVEESADEAETVIKSKMTVYQIEQEQVARVKEAAIQKKLDEGRINPETAVKKMEAVVKPGTSVQGTKGAIQFRTVRKVKIEDESILPREYLIPDLVLIRKDALAGKEIPGVKVVEEKEIAAHEQAS